MITSKQLFERGKGRRGNAEKVRLHEAWAALARGGGSREDFELAIGDLAEQSDYYYIAQPDATPESLMRREGRRELFARILYLLDVPKDVMAEWHAAALVELSITSAEGER